MAGHVASVLRDALDGPVVVVRAATQHLAALPADVRLVDDPVAELGPVQGVVAGMRAIEAEAELAFVAATDLPLLQPAVVRRVVDLLEAAEDADVALPVVEGYPQLLAAAYRTRATGRLAQRLAEGERRLGSVVAALAVRLLTTAELLADPEVAVADPQLCSFINVNDPGEYARVRDGRTG